MNSTLPDELGRICHPHHLWEEIQYNMWGKTDNRDAMLQQAIEFTGDHVRYGSFMMMVANEWRYSCEHNLSFLGHNRRAWIGHAACALALHCPEDVTREAWGYLTQQQQDLANDQADRAIAYWEAQRGQRNMSMRLFDA
ncbi:MAG TPA: hypothetical protein VLH56_19505 [Dissulfurispiraceae bacterium]|nr:hypothetical protein [Dissulfurispiraceae bacterium]